MFGVTWFHWLNSSCPSPCPEDTKHDEIPPIYRPCTPVRLLGNNSGKPCVLGAKVYSQVGPRVASAGQATSTLRGVCEDDVLLGEGLVPFSLLKELPFHYLPMKLYAPPSSPCRCPAAAMLVPNSGDCSACTTTCGSGGLEGLRASGSRGKEERGLLGIGIAMVFPNPSIPDLPASPYLDSAHSPSRRSPSSLPEPNTARRATARRKGRDETEVLLMVHEAEALASIRS